jgi:hypothetical protein
LKQRIGRLLDPLPTGCEETQMSAHGPLLTLLATALLALVLGLMFGERVVRALFWIAA